MKLSKNIAISESGFIFNPTTGDSFSCNSVAADIVNLLKEGLPKEEIKKKIVAKYDVDTTMFDRDLQDFNLQLRENNLLQQ
jgi:hypothetical protein